ncbi:MAG: hypothetical protein ACHQ4H_19100, partial [Ktedonobacterales bacterium]
MATTLRTQTSLTALERVLLLIPAAGALVFGLGPLLALGALALVAGARGHDPIIYRLAGAATLGYAVALLFAIGAGTWRAAHLPVLATLGFNAASIYACGASLAGGMTQPVIYLILATSIIIVAITIWLLLRHAPVERPTPDSPSWLIWFLVLATAISIPFALLPLFVPATFSSLFGLQGTDVFTFRQGGAAVLGYGVLGIFELRSRAWSEIFPAALMVLTFDGLVAIVCALVLLGQLPDAGGSLAPLSLIAGGCVAVAT